MAKTAKLILVTAPEIGFPGGIRESWTGIQFVWGFGFKHMCSNSLHQQPKHSSKYAKILWKLCCYMKKKKKQGFSVSHAGLLHTKKHVYVRIGNINNIV